jgi:hypothetical protein
MGMAGAVAWTWTYLLEHLRPPPLPLQAQALAAGQRRLHALDLRLPRSSGLGTRLRVLLSLAIQLGRYGE